MRLHPTLFCFLAACSTDPKPLSQDTGILVFQDNDGDGYSSSEDCDDSNSLVNPSALELCDGIDNDCDDEIDEELLITFYQDADGDGFGNLTERMEACSAPEGYSNNGNDCDDDNPDSYPGANERCDGRDNDCDGELDENLLELWYLDADGDGYGSLEDWIESCDPGLEYVADSTDCNDEEATVFPSANELCDLLDNDCDEEIDEGVTIQIYVDADMDGYGDSNLFVEVCEPQLGYAEIDGDCDDIDPSINPDADEQCDGVDNNCDGLTDDPSSIDAEIWFQDADADGSGAASLAQIACAQPIGTVANSDDCDDTNDSIYPAAPEICDGLLNDCNSNFPSAETDDDGDGYIECFPDTAGWYGPAIYGGNDCDDGDPNIHPAATEICDLIDNDCDQLIDDADTDRVGGGTFYQDNDADYYGSTISSTACLMPGGYVAASGDCDDSNAQINPGATEVCDSIDNDCDQLIDDTDNSLDLSTATSWYLDNDGDLYGTGIANIACAQPLGWVNQAGDCDDSTSAANPAAAEICDNIDNDCDQLIDGDDGSLLGSTPHYADDDGDGFGDPSNSIIWCETSPAGYTTDYSDCDDSSSAANPMALEICDNIDNDCDQLIDDADPDVLGGSTYFTDGDGDGYGSSPSITACNQPGGTAINADDCDDTDSNVSPGSAEVCGNGVDDDCDGATSEGCPSTSIGCGGPGALQPGSTLSCNFGGTRYVHQIWIAGGCNDGESGNYTFTFSDGSTASISGGCGASMSITPRMVSSATIRMNSGGGGDNNISWTCCGSNGWGVRYY